ncbi:MAG TPA: inner membrane CreD family protein, partial [Bacteroidales bacterium]|nr:inner membrane CreD family protein [Bacteroidales bacterium]
MENENVKQEKWYQTVTVKMALLGFLGIMLLIPLVLIKEVIRERAQNAEQARTEIGNLWAGSQTITGPVLNVPGVKVISNDGDYSTTTMHILPDELNVTGDLSPEKRYRGIYETVVYDSDISMTGSFSLAGNEHLDDYVYQWNQAYISVGVSDNKGFNGDVVLKIGGVAVDAQPGAGQSD